MLDFDKVPYNKGLYDCHKLLKNKNIYRVYKDTVKDDKKLLKSVREIVGTDYYTFIFPKIAILNKDALDGYVIPYIGGISLDTNRDSISFENICDSLDMVYLDTYELSKRKILLRPVLASDMILDKNKNLRILNNDFAHKSIFNSVNGIYKSNLAIIHLSILEYLIDTNKLDGAIVNVCDIIDKSLGIHVHNDISTEEMRQILYFINEYICHSLNKCSVSIDDTNKFIRTRYKNNTQKKIRMI